MNYFLIIIIPTICYILENIASRKEKIFEKIGILFIVIMSSIRYGFGADYFTYQSVFYDLSSGINVEGFEVGFVFLNKIIGFMGLPFNFLLFVIAVFNATLVYISLKRVPIKYRWLSLFLYLTYFDLFFYGLSAIRQSIVVSIFIYSVKYIQQKQLKKYILWILFGQLFHRTAFLLILVYFIYHKYRKLNYRSRSILSLSILIVYSVSIKFLEFLEPYLNRRLKYYLFLDGSSSIGSNIGGLLVILVILIAWIYITTNIIEKNIKDDIYNVYMFAIVIFILLKGMQYIHYYGFIPRIQMYFYSVYIFVVPCILQKIESKIKNITIVLLVSFMTITFTFRYKELNKSVPEFYGKYNTILNTINK